MRSWQQDDSRTRHSACPTEKSKKRATWTNYNTTYAIPRRTYTSSPESNETPSSASRSSLTPTTSRFSTKTKSTYTTPTRQQLSSLEVQFSEDGDANKQSYGESPSSKTSQTRTPTQSSAIDARRNFYPTDHRRTKQSTTCTR